MRDGDPRSLAFLALAVIVVVALPGCFPAFILFGTMMEGTNAIEEGGIDYSVPSDEERAALRVRAEQGSVPAATRPVLDDREQAPLLSLAESGDAFAQFGVFEMLERSGKASEAFGDGPERALH